jgi:hypothetical protein
MGDSGMVGTSSGIDDLRLARKDPLSLKVIRPDPAITTNLKWEVIDSSSAMDTRRTSVDWLEPG